MVFELAYERYKKPRSIYPPFRLLPNRASRTSSLGVRGTVNLFKNEFFVDPDTLALYRLFGTLPDIEERNSGTSTTGAVS